MFLNNEWAIECPSRNRFLIIIIYNVLSYSKSTDDESIRYFKEKEKVKKEFIYFILNEFLTTQNNLLDILTKLCR